MTGQSLECLLEAAAQVGRVLILPHNDPDPDAIASAVALRYLLAGQLDLECTIAYRGIIGRAENKALVHYLGQPLQRLAASHLRETQGVALVDSQPGAGNNALPAGSHPLIVLDHHPWREESAVARFHDVRPKLGSTSTLLVEYLQAAGLEPPTPLATALFYGIKSDTLGLVRGASQADVAAYFSLQPRVDVEALIEIERAQVPAEYFQRLDAALHTARVYGSVLLADVGSMRRPDLAAEMADLLLRLQGVRWALCTGNYKGELILAVRGRSPQGGAGRLVQQIVGAEGTAGGHGVMASGHVPLRDRDPQQMTQELSRRALKALGIPPDEASRPLLGQASDDPP